MTPRAPGQTLSFGRAHLVASGAIHQARQADLDMLHLEAVGGIRRFEPEVRSIALLGTAPASAHPDVLHGVTALPFAGRSERIDERTLQVTLDRGHLVLHLTEPEHAGAALVWHTGSVRHVELLKARAHERDLRLDHGRLTTAAGDPVECPSEHELYRRLGLPFIPPELRAGDDEVAHAERGTLPNLVTEKHIRGDLHTHTNWSDGRDTLEEMLAAGAQLGYQYFAITDHSHRSPASRTLSINAIARQRDEIALLQKRFPAIALLHGIEVDIMPDGELDFSDDILSGFDIVLASLHMDDGQDGARLTERYLKAIRHSLVNVITHPANRTPGRSAGFDVDFDALFAAAAETGTAMEIDGAPGHLDMDGALARRAVAAGVTVTIDSDCHRADWLGRQMRFGVGTARRGWIEQNCVLNTGGVQTVREFVTRKRTRG